ncbi:hypothetical protein FB451DRAFT_312460 [Mycena latifolia]|nr:hypothetical protein FB451DRAFT_312460 [Mycena latifolia]
MTGTTPERLVNLSCSSASIISRKSIPTEAPSLKTPHLSNPSIAATKYLAASDSVEFPGIRSCSEVSWGIQVNGGCFLVPTHIDDVLRRRRGVASIITRIAGVLQSLVVHSQHAVTEIRFTFIAPRCWSIYPRHRRAGFDGSKDAMMAACSRQERTKGGTPAPGGEERVKGMDMLDSWDFSGTSWRGPGARRLIPIALGDIQARSFIRCQATLWKSKIAHIHYKSNMFLVLHKLATQGNLRVVQILERRHRIDRKNDIGVRFGKWPELVRFSTGMRRPWGRE